jgi:hypothetical protein
MTDHERQVVFAEARANVARLDGLQIERHDPSHEDPLERWERQRPQPEPPPRPRGLSAGEIEQLRAHSWAAFIDSRIAAAFTARDAVRLEAMGQVIAAERARHRDELAKLRASLELRIDALAQELAKQRGLADGEVVDLPLALRKRDAAA